MVYMTPLIAAARARGQLRRTRRTFRNLRRTRARLMNTSYRHNFQTGGRMPVMRRRGRRAAALAARRLIGKPVGTNTTKTHQLVNTDMTIKNTRELYWRDLTQIPLGTGIDERERWLINLRGIRIKMIMKNNKKDNPIMVSVAVVKDKESAADQGVDTAFFRGHSGSRTKDFGLNMTSLQMMTHEINTDKYAILKRRTYTISGTLLSTVYNPYRRNWKTINWYIPIKRQIQYDGLEQGTATDKIWLVYWCDLIGASDGAPQDPAALTTMEYHYAVFRDPE